MDQSEPQKKNWFKPGQSGNPGGRPKGSSITANLNKIASEQTTADGVNKGEAIARAIVEKAMAGCVQAAAFFAERTEGKVKSVLSLNGSVTFPDTAEKLVEGVLDILHRIIPDRCPHCRQDLDFKNKLAAEFMKRADQSRDLEYKSDSPEENAAS